MRRLGSCLVVPLFVCLLGCSAQMKWAQTWQPNRTLYVKGPDEVQVFTSSTPDRPYKELGIIEAKGTGSSLSKLVSEMRTFAGERGCDALIVMGSAHGDNVRLYRGSCVLYVQGSRAAAPRQSAPERACVPNSTQLCHGPGACRGAQSCVADGSGYTPCDCGSPPQASEP